MVLGLGTLWGRCPCLGSVLGWGGQCCVAQLEARMCWDEEGAEGRAAGDAQPKACHPALPLPVPSHHFPHGAKLPFDCALFLLHFSFPPLFLNTLSALSHMALLFPAVWGAVLGDGSWGSERGL